MQMTQLTEGRYLYCIANTKTETDLGEMGIDDNKVYTIPLQDVSAVVHDCPAKPYESEDAEKVKEWILAHQYIIDVATKKFGTVIPFGFDTIIKGNDEVVKSWLENEYPRLKDKLEGLKDKSEYTVQIFIDSNSLTQKIEERDEEIKKLKWIIHTKPKGVAYMLKQKLDKMIRDRLATEITSYSNDFYYQIKEYVDDVKVENADKQLPNEFKDKKMILNLSCLVYQNNVEKLGNLLGKINESKGFAVRFTGPWAPFSFVKSEENGTN